MTYMTRKILIALHTKKNTKNNKRFITYIYIYEYNLLLDAK